MLTIIRLGAFYAEKIVEEIEAGNLPKDVDTVFGPAYKGIPLSMGPVLEATSYIYVTIFGVTIFKEKLNRRKLIGLALIVLGIIVYSLLR